MKRLSNIREALLMELKNDSAKLHFVNTRLILNTGVNLNDIKPTADGDPKTVETALTTLHKMGFLRETGGAR